MLINYDPTQPLFIVGTSVSTHEIKHWITEELGSTAKIVLVSKEEYNKLPFGAQCMLGFADMTYRKNLINEPMCHEKKWVSFVHRNSIVTEIDKLGYGAVIQPMVFVGYNVTVGNFSWIATHSHIGHGSTLGDNVVASPATMITGSVQIGNNVHFGQSSSIKDRILIANDAEFCMNSIVTKNITDSGKYYGNKKVYV